MRIIVLLLLTVVTVPDATADFDVGDLPSFWDALNNRALRKEMDRPEKFPAFVYRSSFGGSTKIGRYLLGGKSPHGPMQCEHLRIHQKKSDDVLTWEARDTAASNVYYHVHRAIDYFNWLSAQVGEAVSQERGPVDVRIGMDVGWAMWVKYSKDPRQNTSQTLPDVDPDKWNTPEERREIWFYVPKRAYFPKYVVSRFVPGVRDTVLGTTGFPLDSARVPTIVYHEWTHLMTRPYLGIAQDTVLNEGYSDYFGSVIGGRPEMGDVDEFSTFPYHRTFDRPLSRAGVKDFKTPGNFVPTLLWALRNRFGAARWDVITWKALKYLNPKSGLGELPAALLRAAEEYFSPEEKAALAKRLDDLITSTRDGRIGS